jgi:hypothetical protein
MCIVFLTYISKASTYEGGTWATLVCVPREQNSRYQGKQMSRFYKNCGLKRGDKFVVRIEGGCSNVKPPVDWYLDPPTRRDLAYTKREVITGPVGINETDSTLRDPQGDGSFTFMALGLDELNQGRYELSVEFSGTADRISVIDNSGEEYAA